MRLLLKTFVVLGATVLMVALWNLPSLVSLGTPYFRQIVPLSQTQAANTFQYIRLGIQAPITEAAATSPLKTQDWDKIRPALHHGVSLSYEGNDFETAPLVFITGHSSDTYPHPYSAIFAGLGGAKIGDTFTVTLNKGSITYKVISTKVINPYNVTAFTDLAPKDPSKRYVALVTCWPVFTTANRLVILAERMGGN